MKLERKVHRVQQRPPKPKLLRVVAYARVSSGKDAMLHSLAAQVDYFQNLIRQHPGWEFCGVFADEAKTGTKDERPEYQKMLEKCRNREVDLVITKSISRFARNTVTLLETVRELKSLGIDVYFEKENLHSTSGDGELMLSILASFAQEESKSVSDNMKWRIRNDFQQGKIGSITIFGYRRNADGVLEIEESEAKIVQMIFADYCSGMGQCAIAKKINAMGISTRQGNRWTGQRVKEILVNEKYVGNMLLQKYYRQDPIGKRKMKNQGELPKYFVEQSHESIISANLFKKVQNLVKNRRNNSPIPVQRTVIRCPAWCSVLLAEKATSEKFTSKVRFGCVRPICVKENHTVLRQSKFPNGFSMRRFALLCKSKNLTWKL